MPLLSREICSSWDATIIFLCPLLMIATPTTPKLGEMLKVRLLNRSTKSKKYAGRYSLGMQTESKFPHSVSFISLQVFGLGFANRLFHSTTPFIYQTFVIQCLARSHL